MRARSARKPWLQFGRRPIPRSASGPGLSRRTRGGGRHQGLLECRRHSRREAGRTSPGRRSPDLPSARERRAPPGRLRGRPGRLAPHHPHAAARRLIARRGSRRRRIGAHPKPSRRPRPPYRRQSQAMRFGRETRGGTCPGAPGCSSQLPAKVVG